ncbi:hypothetical protein CLF_107049 [Clonorchis sinensis]|uniref:Reverse transcriptase RNase H-like domain-containing protein n=1 Tax=Clonorchis sinensis TaxID=79923 RepID=G7YQD3_CLOSI|nr:hypothetical protein CLF_107049 [Clonorchis sinensis]
MPAVKRPHKYLFGSNFTTATDHEALKFLYHPTKSMARSSAVMVQQCIIALSSYTYTTAIRSAKMIPHADFLSSIPSWDSDSNNADRLLIQPLPVKRDALVADTKNLDCAKTADVTFFKGNDLRPATGIVLSSNGKRMVTVLNLDDVSSQRRHIDQVEFNTRVHSVKGTPAVANTNESFVDDLTVSEQNVISEGHTTCEEPEVYNPRSAVPIRQFDHIGVTCYGVPMYVLNLIIIVASRIIANVIGWQERSSKSRIVTIRLPFDESTIPVAGRKSLPLKNVTLAVLAQSRLVRNERDLNRSAGLFPHAYLPHISGYRTIGGLEHERPDSHIRSRYSDCDNPFDQLRINIIITLRFVRTACVTKEFDQVIQKHLSLLFPFEDDNDVCIPHIGKFFVRYLKTGVQKILVSREL